MRRLLSALVILLGLAGAVQAQIVLPGGGGGTGTVTSVSVTTANGVSAVSNGDPVAPALTFTLGAITPTSVNGLTSTSNATGFSIAGGTTSKTFTLNNTLGLSGTDGSTLNIGAGGTLGTNAFTSTAYCPLTGCTYGGTVTFADTGTWSSTGLVSNQLLIGNTGTSGIFVYVGNTNSASFRITTPASSTQRLLAFTNPGNTIEYFSLDVNQLSQPVFDLRSEGHFLFSSNLANYITDIPAGGGATSISTGAFSFSSSSTDPRSSIDTILTRGGVANLQLGAADAAAPVSQTLSCQSVIAGTTNAVGANCTFAGSKGTGTGIGGSLVFQTAPAGTTGTAQNAEAAALTINSAQLVGFNKHIAGLGSAPTAVASGGTGSASLSTGANDDHGTVTGGTLSTSIVVTFVNAFVNAPDCVVTPDGSVVPTTVSTASGGAGAATLTIGMAAATGAKFTYHCMGQ